MLRLDGQVAFLRHLGKVGSGIDPLQLVVGRDIDDTQVKMLARGACTRVAGHAQFLSGIDHIADGFLNLCDLIRQASAAYEDFVLLQTFVNFDFDFHAYVRNLSDFP